MAEDFLERLEAAFREARARRRSTPRIRDVPRPRQEINDALRRWQAMVGYYEPQLRDVKLTILYEYAASRLLRESIVSPEFIAADFQRFRSHYRNWWEEWRTRGQ